MATCPNCQSCTTITLDNRFIARPLDEYSLAGTQIKFSAHRVYVLECETHLGGCGWSITGDIEHGDKGDYFIQRTVLNPGDAHDRRNTDSTDLGIPPA